MDPISLGNLFGEVAALRAVVAELLDHLAPDQRVHLLNTAREKARNEHPAGSPHRVTIDHAFNRLVERK